MNLENLFGIWESEFGRRPVSSSALHWQACNGNRRRSGRHRTSSSRKQVSGSSSCRPSWHDRSGIAACALCRANGNCALWRIERVID